jgi:hypothetical protein
VYINSGNRRAFSSRTLQLSSLPPFSFPLFADDDYALCSMSKHTEHEEPEKKKKTAQRTMMISWTKTSCARGKNHLSMLHKMKPLTDPLSVLLFLLCRTR